MIHLFYKLLISEISCNNFPKNVFRINKEENVEKQNNAINIQKLKDTRNPLDSFKLSFY